MNEIETNKIQKNKRVWERNSNDTQKNNQVFFNMMKNVYIAKTGLKVVIEFSFLAR